MLNLHTPCIGNWQIWLPLYMIQYFAPPPQCCTSWLTLELANMAAPMIQYSSPVVVSAAPCGKYQNNPIWQPHGLLMRGALTLISALFLFSAMIGVTVLIFNEFCTRCRLSKILSYLQGWCRGFLIRRSYQTLCDQRSVSQCARARMRVYISTRAPTRGLYGSTRSYPSDEYKHAPGTPKYP